jgi:hypothetical protein
VALAVAGNIDIVVPPVLHKIDWLTAGVVLVAIPAPVPGVSRGDVQVDRLLGDTHRSPLDYDRTWVDEYRLWNVTDIDAAIEPGLADRNRYAHVGGKRRK